jgi:hypothetical protein
MNESQDCYWPVEYAGCEECVANLTPEELALYEEIATDLLNNWTGGVFGVCDVIVRPCRDCVGGPSPTSTFWGRGPGYDPSFPRFGSSQGFGKHGSGTTWLPVLIGGKWTNISCGCLGACMCEISGAYALHLPGPVQAIIQVTVDGVIVPATSYRVDNQRTLVRIDGGTWPACQNLLLEPTEPGTFEVQYEKGVPVPIGGQVAAGKLACELSKEACGDETCELPANVISVARQGISIGLEDTWEKTQEGWTGIRIIDSWVASVNGRPKPFASVRSPDVRTTPR